MRLFVTGQNGFVGQALQGMAALGEGWSHGGITVNSGEEVDILDRQALFHALGEYRPDAVLHLAAQSNVPNSILDPIGTANVNLLGTLNLLDAIEAVAPQARLLHVGSGDVYGLVDEHDLPVGEDARLAPRNPYAASKVAAEMFVLERARRGRIDAVCTRTFNHTGARQGAGFIFPDIARQAAMIISASQNPEILVGDLDVTRDFLDVRDVVRAYFVLLRSGGAGQVYNVCSGTETNLRQAVTGMLARAGVDAVLKRNPAFLRLSEQRRACGDNRRLQALGWVPNYVMDDTLDQVLAWWLDNSAVVTPQKVS